MSLYIGLMSGTSMDGIDAALTHCPDNRLVCGLTKKYSKDVKERLDSILKAKTASLAGICQLNTLIGKDFAGAVTDLLLKAKSAAPQIQAIGSHGQTLCHNTQSPIPYTMQLGCAHTITTLTGIKVIADFRTKDLVNGGQGAPFAPLYHQELFSKLNRRLAVINIGGIANISLITPGEKTMGWDIGPGNCLMDAWITKYLNKSFDAQGSWAASGTLISELLERLLSDSYFKLSPPKSVGKEYFSINWLDSYLPKQYNLADIQATLLALTAYSIVDTLKNNALDTVYLCGGGVHNSYLVDCLKKLRPETTIQSCAAVGLDPDYLEGMMFAWLAYQRINERPVDLSGITGSKGPAMLGAVYY